MTSCIYTYYNKLWYIKSFPLCKVNKWHIEITTKISSVFTILRFGSIAMTHLFPHALTYSRPTSHVIPSHRSMVRIAMLKTKFPLVSLILFVLKVNRQKATSRSSPCLFKDDVFVLLQSFAPLLLMAFWWYCFNLLFLIAFRWYYSYILFLVAFWWTCFYGMILFLWDVGWGRGGWRTCFFSPRNQMRFKLKRQIEPQWEGHGNLRIYYDCDGQSNQRRLFLP